MMISSTDFDTIRSIVKQESAIVLGDEKRYLVETRMEMLAQELGIESPVLLERIRAALDRELRQRVVEAMTTNETWFFRDQHPFETLRTHVLPELIQARTPSRRLYIWSAACSTGQEPYSLAILLREHFPELRGWNVSMLATDLDRSVLARAERGHYSDVELRRGMPAHLLQRYFRREGDGWTVSPEIRSMVTYRQINLKDTWQALPAMDLVLVRNVLIYFSIETKRQVLQQVRTVMRPDAYLMLGASETTHFLDESFKSVHCGQSVCYRKLEPAVRAA